MRHPDYNSPTELKQILDTNGFSMQKKFGQNFLINESARKKLIENLDITPECTVWEIGPGLGAMTSEILERGADLTVFEIDKGFAYLISKFFEDYYSNNKFRIIEGDVLKTWKNYCTEKGKPSRLFGNLPYNVAATIIADTIENNIQFDKCVFTVQKEVALRMEAKPDTQNYSSFSVLCQWAYDVKAIIDLTGGNFWPKPNVDSRAVLLTKKDNWPNCSNPKLFVKLNRALFSSRRKTVRNNLSIFLQNNDMAVNYLEKAGIDIMKRAEVLTIPELLNLTNIMTEGMSK